MYSEEMEEGWFMRVARDRDEHLLRAVNLMKKRISLESD
jgi:hypothetical protein